MSEDEDLTEELGRVEPDRNPHDEALDRAIESATEGLLALTDQARELTLALGALERVSRDMAKAMEGEDPR